MTNECKKLSEYTQRIVDWNILAGNGPDLYIEECRGQQIQLQTKLLLEECDELEMAYLAQDRVEMVDAVCDIMVVGLYWVTLWYTPFNSNSDVIFKSEQPIPFATDQLESPMQLVSIIRDSLCQGNPHTMAIDINYACQALWVLMVEQLYDGSHELADAAMQEVLNTNSAKYMTLEQANSDLAPTVERYAGRYDNITITPCHNSDTLFCYRSDGGTGKIIKPASWIEPQLPQPR